MSKPRAFELKPDRAGWAKLNSIEGTHAHKLPGVRCPSCGVWAMTGVIYPCVDESALSDKSLPSSAPLSVDQFRSLAVDLKPVLGSERPVMPGTDLGPLRGRGKGTFGDFAWVNPWTPLVRESVWQSLSDAGLKLCAVRAELGFKNQPHESFFELEAVPRAQLADGAGFQACGVCGRVPVSVPDKLVLDATSFDESVALQRVGKLPTALIVNERFARFIQERRLRDVILNAVEFR